MLDCWMRKRLCSVMFGLCALFAEAGEFVLFDAFNYPHLPKAMKGAELVGEYAATRLMDVRFEGKDSAAQIRAKLGDVPGDVATWMSGAGLALICAPTDEPLPAKLKVEIQAVDRSVTPQEKVSVITETVVPAEIAKKTDKDLRLVFPFVFAELAEGRFVPETVKLTASGKGRLAVRRIVVRGPKVADSSIGVKEKGSDDHLWLKVKGRRIVTAASAKGGERPFVPVGCGYGKDVILRGYDELVARYCKTMCLNTVRLAFYNQYFNNRAHEPLSLADVTAFTDQMVNAAKRNDLYVILDDHGYFKNEIDESTARGEQKSAGWTTARFEDWVSCWGRVAEHYKNEPRVLGYELCNEPVCEPEVARKWYKRAIDEIRKHDTRHIVIVGAHHWSHSRSLEATWSGVANKIDAPYNNVVFSFHDYPMDDDPWNVARYLAAFQDKYEVPVMCTEFGNGGTPERVHRECQAAMLALFAREGIGWMIWALQDKPELATGFPTRAKKVEKKWEQVDPPNPRYWIPYPEIWAPVAKIVASPMPKAK